MPGKDWVSFLRRRKSISIKDAPVTQELATDRTATIIKLTFTAGQNGRRSYDFNSLFEGIA